MYDRIFVHVVWTTRQRLPVIDMRIARFLTRFLPAIAQQERARIVELGMVSTHIHLLIRLNPGTNIPRLLQRMKGGSAAISMKEGHAPDRVLRWAKGYSIESVSVRAIEVVRLYIRNQPARHPSEAIEGWPPPPVASSDS